MLKLPKSLEITSDNRVLLLDQTKLPHKMDFIEIKTSQEMYDAIKTLMVRGAPLIGCAAGAGLYVGAKNLEFTGDKSEFYNKVVEIKNHLASSRPTAVNLFWALERGIKLINPQMVKNEMVEVLLNYAKELLDEDIKLCRKIGENGLSLINKNDSILTHCNAGSLATGYYGTALSPMYLAHEKGINFKIFSCETRPLLQGARLTAWELKESGLDVTLICDNMAGWVMKQKMVNKVIIGCDRVAANGDAANKIGSYTLSVLAKYHNIPFYVATPYSTIDTSLENGSLIPIEERNSDEVTTFLNCRAVSQSTKVFNPAFDVVDNENITAFITDKGIIYPPFKGKF